MQKRGSLRIVLVAVVLAAALLARQAQADDIKSVDNASAQEVVDGMAHKAVRGLANLTTGWFELPKQIGMTIKEDGVGKGVTVGAAKGIGMAVVRTVTGAVETATFFVAWPSFFDPYIEPAYVWQKE